jgi:DNA-binding response OmpR family regulator
MWYKDILLIDDDIDDGELFLEAISTLLSESKFRYYTNPVKALEELRNTDKLPDLLFIDINMPCLNGLELLKKLRNDPRLKDIDVILISSPTQDMMRRLWPECEFEKYMCKPNNYNEFVAQLRDIL